MDEGKYSISLDHDQGLVDVVAQGEIRRELGDALITEARELAARHQYNIVCDVRQSKTRLGLTDWYYLPRRLGVYRNLETRFVKTAIIVRKGKQKSIYSFFETVTNNLGLNIKIFLRREDALEWLGKQGQRGET